jgi:hypothetical protein
MADTYDPTVEQPRPVPRDGVTDIQSLVIEAGESTVRFLQEAP